MKTRLYQSLAAIALSGTIATPGAAQDRIGSDSYAVTLHGADLHPASAEKGRRMLVRIENAALLVCGASPFSLREIKLAVRDSDCWRTSMAETVAQIDAPLLTQAYHRQP